jgi:hypothetical protein
MTALRSWPAGSRSCALREASIPMKEDDETTMTGTNAAGSRPSYIISIYIYISISRHRHASAIIVYIFGWRGTTATERQSRTNSDD